MGGFDPFFEESKVSSDPSVMVSNAYSMFENHPVYTCMAFGGFVLSILVYTFLQQEYVNI